MEKYTVVFMGTPDFAVPCIEKIFEHEQFELLAAYTQPDKPVGRKQVLTAPPVKEFALKNNIPVFQPPKIRKNQEVLDHLTSLKPDFIIVVAYGKILPQSILDIPKYGCINVHASLLEKYRGAAPIQWSIAKGEKITGVTVMAMDAGMDTGDLYTQAELDIKIDDTSESLSPRLSALGAELLLKTLPGIIDKTILPKKQNSELATMAPIIKKEDGLINWSDQAWNIYNLGRAFTPWPQIYTFLNGNPLKVIQAEVLDENSTAKPGSLIELAKTGIKVATGEKVLLLKRVQASGSKEMSAADFARGQRLEVGTILGGEA